MPVIRKGWPIVVPHFTGTLSGFDVTPLGGIPNPFDPVVTYAAFSWTGFPIQDVDGTALPIRGVKSIPGFPLLYPRNMSAFAPITVTPAAQAYMDAHLITGWQSGANRNRSGFLPGFFEPSDYEAVDDGESGTVVMADSVGNRWQGGDLLYFDQDVGDYLRYFHYDDPMAPTAVIANDAMIAHDQARANAVQAAFERIKLIYWYLETGAALEADIITLYATIVAGVSNAEFHTATVQSDVDDSLLAALTAFYGA